MPELLTDGLPGPVSRSKFDFARFADGQAWKFVKGEDYDSSTSSFRHSVRRWARANGFVADTRPYPEVDYDGRELPQSRAEPVALGVRFTPARGSRVRAR